MLGVIDFDVRVPYDDSIIRTRVAENLKRNLPEVQMGHEREGVLNIIANGPTAVQSIGQCLNEPTLALNNALRLGTPTYWAGCDPQPILAKFLEDAPEGVTYYCASKCHPDVFDVLDGRDVQLWHIGEDHPLGVPTACSITLTAMSLFRLLGFKHFRTWGWDGCYIDGKDHAVGQPHNRNDITVMVDGTPYHTTPTWACEAQDACNQLAYADYTVEVMGEGMIGAVLRARGVI